MAFLPGALLVLFAFWCGSFPGGATATGAAGGMVLLLGAALAAAPAWGDPLRLGRLGRFVPAFLFIVVAASLWVSSVPRAGRVALLMLPAWLLLPAFVARCWRGENGRRAAPLSAAIALVAVAGWALFELGRRADAWRWERAAMPLGHHNLLAAFLVILVPLAAVGLRRRGAPRALAFVAVAAALVALLATRSFLHLGILAAMADVLSFRFERARDFVLGLALVGIAMLLPRAAAMLAGADSSAAARAVYARAAWDGFLARPLLGWGPGSTPWTLAENLRPRPGVNPAGEIVGEAHSLPLQLLRELGLAGFACAATIVVLFFVARWRRPATAADRPLLEAGLVAVGAGLLSGLGADWLAVTALPAALAFAAGATLAGEADRASATATLAARGSVALYVAAAAVFLLPIARAHAEYDAGIRQPGSAAAAPFLERAMRLDPAFPLYRARWAWAASGAPAESRADEAIAAARAARGVAALWLRAGVVALEAKRDDLASESFTRAMALDPLSAFAPFELAPLSGDPAGCAARAVAAEPRLLAASLFRGGETARQATIRRLESFGAIDAGWRLRAGEVGRALEIEGDDDADLVAAVDGEPAVSLSLHAFRRAAWPADLARLAVDRSAVQAIRDLPPATTIPGGDPAAFPADRCLP